MLATYSSYVLKFVSGYELPLEFLPELALVIPPERALVIPEELVLSLVFVPPPDPPGLECTLLGGHCL